MKKFLKAALVLAIIGVLYYALLGSFRYKNYSSSDYVFLLKDKGKIYKMDEISIVGDRITGENYILLGLRKNWGHVYELGKIFRLANSSYKITETDSKFYDGILEEDYLAKSFVEITNTRNELNLHRTEEIKTVDINYNGKSKRLVLSPKYKNWELKSLSFWVCSKRSNGAVCGNPRGYGISFDKLKDEFGLNLDIEVDNRRKVVYFIKE